MRRNRNEELDEMRRATPLLLPNNVGPPVDMEVKLKEIREMYSKATARPPKKPSWGDVQQPEWMKPTPGA